MRIYTYGAARALLSVDRNAVATFQFGGVLTRPVLMLALDDLSAYIARRSVQAIVVRSEDAQIPVGIKGTVSDDIRSVPKVLQILPVACVVRGSDYAATMSHTVKMAQHGLIRRAFTRYEPALEWATRKGQALQPFPPELPYFRETQ